MSITLKQSIEITAQAMFNRAGPNAVDEALKQSMYLKKIGDNEGFDVWTEIAKIISSYNAKKISNHPRQISHNLV